MNRPGPAGSHGISTSGLSLGRFLGAFGWDWESFFGMKLLGP